MECGPILPDPGQPAPLSPDPIRAADAASPGHLLAIAEVLVELSGEIEGLGAQLCTDPSVIVRHLEPLQAIDLIAQKQRWLATMLRAECPVTAVGRIGVDALRDRLSPACRGLA